MASDYATKVKIVQANGLDPLISLLSSDDPDIQHNALTAVYHLVEARN